uniref:Titin n=1 Tax=Cyprinus carpio TaxID=7962 RepID=A0A8C1WA28_CYPCA
TPEATDITRTSMQIVWDKPSVDGGSMVTGYYLERRNKKSLRWVKMYKDPISDTKAKVHHLTEGNEYQYRVCAINKAGEGPYSVVSDFYKAADPVGIINNLNCYFAEEAQVDTDVAMRTHYIVKAGKDVEIMVPLKGRPAPNVSWKKEDQNIDNDPKYDIHNTDTSSCLIITQVTRNDTGKYTINISNGVGEPKSLTVSVKVQDTPAACRNLILKDVTRGKVTLCWESPLLDGGAEITNFVVEKRDSSKRTYACVTNKCKETTCVIEELSEKLKELTEMFFRVCSKNEKGTSDFVEIGPIKVKDYIIPPEANLKEYPDGQISVRLGHNVHIELPYKGKPRPAILWLKDNLPLKESEKIRFKKTENKATLMIKNVEKENEGKYTLTLDNTFFRKSFHIQVITLGPPSKPVGPIRLDEVRAEKSITINWAPPTHDGGNPVKYYIVERREKKTGRWLKVLTRKPIVEAAHRVTHLTENVEYEFRVYAVNDAGIGAPSNISMPIKCAEPTEEPDAPSIVNVTDTTNTSVSMEWTRPASDGGMEIHGYIIEMRKGSEEEWHRVNEDLCAVTKYNVTGLETGAEYKFRICAVNSVGKGETKEITESVQAVDRLLAPEIDIDASFKQTHIVKSGGSVYIRIAFKGKPTPTASWTKVDGELGTTQTSLRVSDLLEGVPYFFRVMAENQYGLGEAYEMPDPVIATAEPAPPKRVDIIDTTDKSATLVWIKPEHDGGSRITGYCVESKAKDADKWIVCGTTKNLSLIIEGLIENSEYEFRVKAKNDSGFSVPREAFSSVIIKDKLLVDTVIIRAGSDLVLDAAVGGKPEPKVNWSKGTKELELCEKYALQYSSTRALAIIKFCDRDDTGKYVLTVKNASGTKTAEVNVKVLGKYAKHTAIT